MQAQHASSIHNISSNIMIFMMHPQHVMDTIQSPTDNETQAIPFGVDDLLEPTHTITSLYNGNPDHNNDNPYSYYYEDGSANTQSYISAAIPVDVAFLSLMGCYIAMRESWMDYRHSSSGRLRRQSSTLGRRRGETTLSQALSLQNSVTATCYFTYAFALVWGPLPAPSEIDFAWTRGRQGTCTAQGLLVQLGAASASLEHSFLVWMHVFLVKYNWSEPSLQAWVNRAGGVAAVISVTMAVVPAFLGYYNYNSETKCWIATFPYQCGKHSYNEGEEVDCIRGSMAGQLQILYFLFPHWVLAVCNLISLCLIWSAVRTIENQSTKYAGGSNRSSWWMSGEKSFPVANSSDDDGNQDSSQLDEQDPQQAPQQSQPQQSPEEFEISVNRTKSRAVATQGILLGMIYTIFLGVSSLEVVFKIIAEWSPYWLAQISNAFIAIPGLFFFLVFGHSREASKMKTPEGRFVRRYFLQCFYKGWERMVHYVVPAQSKTRVSVASSSNSRRPAVV